MLNIKEKQLLTVLMNSQNLEIHQKLQSDYMALDIFNLIGAIFNEKIDVGQQNWDYAKNNNKKSLK